MMDLLATVPYYTAYLAKALLQHPIDLTVGSISYYLDADCYTSRGIRIDPGLLDVVGRFRLPRLPRRTLKLLEEILNLCALTTRFIFSPPDVMHVQYLPMMKTGLPLDLWFMRFCGWRGSKIVLTVHDLLPHDSGDEHRAKFDKLYRRVDAIICHSDSVRVRLATEFSVPEEKVSVIAHGPFFYDLPADNCEENLRSFAFEPGNALVLWQGIIFPYKGIDVLLRAWQQVEAKLGDTCLMIAGTGAPEMLQEIRAQVETLGLKQVRLYFRFVGSEELVALYRAADVVVYPFHAITTSGSLATGLALGKTIVASDLPVIRELLTDRENALLVAPHDPDALAGALMELVQDAPLRAKLADNVRAMNFGDESWRTITKQTMAVYRRVLVRGG
jgi:glycosyltransferase involved in cell wall biosynthesis